MVVGTVFMAHEAKIARLPNNPLIPICLTILIFIRIECGMSVYSFKKVFTNIQLIEQVTLVL